MYIRGKKWTWTVTKKKKNGDAKRKKIGNGHGTSLFFMKINRKTQSPLFKNEYTIILYYVYVYVI